MNMERNLESHLESHMELEIKLERNLETQNKSHQEASLLNKNIHTMNNKHILTVGLESNNSDKIGGLLNAVSGKEKEIEDLLTKNADVTAQLNQVSKSYKLSEGSWEKIRSQLMEDFLKEKAMLFQENSVLSNKLVEIENKSEEFRIEKMEILHRVANLQRNFDHEKSKLESKLKNRENQLRNLKGVEELRKKNNLETKVIEWKNFTLQKEITQLYDYSYLFYFIFNGFALF